MCVINGWKYYYNHKNGCRNIELRDRDKKKLIFNIILLNWLFFTTMKYGLAKSLARLGIKLSKPKTLHNLLFKIKCNVPYPFFLIEVGCNFL